MADAPREHALLSQTVTQLHACHASRWVIMSLLRREALRVIGCTLTQLRQHAGAQRLGDEPILRA
jgi:hypothetical protein